MTKANLHTNRMVAEVVYLGILFDTVERRAYSMILGVHKYFDFRVVNAKDTSSHKHVI